MKNLLLLIFLLASCHLIAQVPTTNIYLFDYLPDDNGKVVLNKPRILSASNLDGYNNQPRWFNDEELYTTRQRAGNDQTDLVIYNIQNETETLFTKTRQSEYSATPTPDGKHLSCIRVEDDGVQVLWQYPLDRSHGGKRILNHIQDIGYHFWVNDSEVVLFIVGSPLKFVLANTSNTDTYEISTKIGRCFGQLDNGQILFVYKYTEDIWHLKSFDPSTKRSKFIAETPKGSQDFAIIEGGSIIMGQGSKLLRSDAPYTSWVEIGDVRSYDINNISRLAYHRGKLAVIGQ